MASLLARGVRRSVWSLQRQPVAPLARAGCRHRQAAPAALVTRPSTASHDQKQFFHGTRACTEEGKESSTVSGVPRELDEFKDFFNFPSQSPEADFVEGATVTVHGFSAKRRDLSKKNSFVDLIVDSGPSFQFESSWEDSDSPERALHKALRAIPAWSPVAMTGKIDSIHSSSDASLGSGTLAHAERVELTLTGVHLLNPFPNHIIISKGAKFPPYLRHLQLRFDKVLQDRLKLRNELTAQADAYLRKSGFTHVETPVLFKSTPEGAREFLVPTRRPGFAYALPQSPQQYKQMLMASGVRKYFQFARCFRDEDLRADRQPEFTQLDLEMSFATGKDVMVLVEGLVKDLYAYIRRDWRTREIDGQLCPVKATRSERHSSDESPHHSEGLYPSITPGPEAQNNAEAPFPRITYDEAMSQYGSDKPDLRIPNKIRRIEHILPPSFTSMISDHENPIVEACVFSFQDHADPKTTKSFITSLWDTLPKALGNNPDGQPAPLFIDSSKPLSGLSSLGHEAADALLSSPEHPLSDGDVLILQARPNAPFTGGATALGTLRKHIYDEAVAQHLLPRDNTFHFLWVTAFPLFTPTAPDAADPGQGGAAGFAATHHPFTAPRSPADFALLATDPLAAKADHYDLVVNGVELGGGSRRIHVAAVQEHVFRSVLRMSDVGIAHFAHLLDALRAGCPPHAGFALGWDRVCATLGFTASVRDVIAFPKSKKGEEPVAKVPGRVGMGEWAVYGLRAVERE